MLARNNWLREQEEEEEEGRKEREGGEEGRKKGKKRTEEEGIGVKKRVRRSTLVPIYMQLSDWLRRVCFWKL